MQGMHALLDDELAPCTLHQHFCDIGAVAMFFLFICHAVEYILIINNSYNHNHNNNNMFQQMLRVCGTSLVSPGWHIPGITAGTCVEYKTVISNQ